MPELRHGVSTGRLFRLNDPVESPPASAIPAFLRLVADVGPTRDLFRDPLPDRLRPEAQLHILDITKYFGPTTGGIRTYLLEKARFVSRHPDLRQTLVVPGESGGVADGDGVRCYRVAGPMIPLQSQYRALTAGRTIRRIIEHEQPDLIEVGSPFLTPWLVRWANRGSIPMVWFYHGNLTRLAAPRSAMDSREQRWRSALARWYVGRTGRMFRATIAASEFAANDLEAAGVRHVVRTSLGVDLEQFHPRRRAGRASIRHAAGWPAGPVVLYMGRIAGEKALDLPVRAWNDVNSQTGATLVLLGDGPDRGRLAALGATPGILWHPHVREREHLADLVAAADLYLAPGPVETFGLSALEAMASGIPVLSVDSGGVPELVDAAKSGALYRIGDTADFTAKTVALVTSDLEPLGLAGRAYVETHHDWNSVLPALFDSYRHVVRP